MSIETEARPASPVSGRPGSVVVVVVVVTIDPAHDWPVIELNPADDVQPGNIATPFTVVTELVELHDIPVVALYPLYELHPAM